MLSYKNRSYANILHDSTDRDIFDRLLDIFQIKGGHFTVDDEIPFKGSVGLIHYHMTYEQIAKTFNVTRERIRQVEQKALRKLKHPSRSRLLRSFMYDEDLPNMR